MLTYIIYCLDAYIYIICFVFYTNQRFHSMFFSILMIYLNTIKMDLRAHTHTSAHIQTYLTRSKHQTCVVPVQDSQTE